MEKRVRIVRLLVELGDSLGSEGIEEIANQRAEQITPAQYRQLARYAVRAASLMETAAKDAERAA